MVISGLILLSGCSSIEPQQKTEEPPAVRIREGATEINIGNEICPVSGEKIDEKTKVTQEYNGIIYNFCCSECVEEFKKDPQKYIDRVEEELKARVEEKERQRQIEIEKQSEPMQAPHEEHLTY